MKLDELRAFAALKGTSAHMTYFGPEQAAELVAEIDARLEPAQAAPKPQRDMHDFEAKGGTRFLKLVGYERDKKIGLSVPHCMPGHPRVIVSVPVADLLEYAADLGVELRHAEVERQLQITRERFEALRAEVDKLHANLVAQPKVVTLDPQCPKGTVYAVQAPTADEVFDKRWRELTNDGQLDGSVSTVERFFDDLRYKLRAIINPPEHVLKALDAVRAQSVAEVKRGIVARWNVQVEP